MFEGLRLFLLGQNHRIVKGEFFCGVEDQPELFL